MGLLLIVPRELLVLVVLRERGYYTINKSSEGSSEAIRWCGKQGNMDPL